MSYILKRAAELAWADRIEHGKRHRARDPWCVSKLERSGGLTSSQAGAARRLARLIERGQGQRSGGGLERVDRSGTDPHARMFDAAVCAREAECALASVATRLSGPCLHVRLACLHAAMDTPHQSVAAACVNAGLSRNSHVSFARHLIAALDLLAVYFDSVDAEADRHAEKISRAAH